MTKKERALLAIELLKQVYPDAICSLDYEKPHELLISTRLAAQCTDARVNIVTKDLYQKYQSLEDFASADLAELEEMVRPCGFYHTKAKDIIAMSQMLLDQYDGVLPDTVEELTKLPGVGRKTANLIVGDIYHKPAIVCRHPLHPHYQPAGAHHRKRSGKGGRSAAQAASSGGIQ